MLPNKKLHPTADKPLYKSGEDCILFQL